jgi:hypothetical protein
MEMNEATRQWERSPSSSKAPPRTSSCNVCSVRPAIRGGPRSDEPAAPSKRSAELARRGLLRHLLTAWPTHLDDDLAPNRPAEKSWCGICER